MFCLEYTLLGKHCCGIGPHKPIMGSQEEQTEEAKNP